MDQATHNRIVSFIWGIADDVLRDLFRRGKYPDPLHVMKKGDALPTHEGRTACGMQTLATMSQQLAAGFGSWLNSGQAIVVTLSRQSRGPHIQALLPIQVRHVRSPSR